MLPDASDLSDWSDLSDLFLMDHKHVLAGHLAPGMNFNERVWTLTARIPRGRVGTYGQIAHKLGTRAYRAVGNALHHNPHAPAVPCHRVVGSDGRLTGFAGGLTQKRRILLEEGVSFVAERVDLERCQVKL